MMKLNHILLLVLALEVNIHAAAGDAPDCLQALKNNDTASAIQIADKRIAQDKTDYDAFMCKATAQNKLMQHDAALASYTDALNIVKQNGNNRIERIIHQKSGDILMQQTKVQEALKQYELTAPLAMNDNERGDIFERLAAAYLALKQNDKAIEYTVKAARMHELTGELERLAEAYLQIGDLSTKSKDFPQAESALKRLLKLSQEYGNLYYEAKAKLAQARLKAASGDAAAAQALKQEAQNIAEGAKATQLAEEIRAEKL